MVNQEECNKHLAECEDCTSISDRLKIELYEHLKKPSKKRIFKCTCCNEMKHSTCFTCTDLIGRIRRTIKFHIYWLKFKRFLKL